MGVINLGILIKKVANKLSKSGFIKATDYASASTGGTVKVGNSRGSSITGTGVLQAETYTATQYATINDKTFISKGTLEALITAGTLGGMVAYSDTETKIGTLFGEDLYCKVIHKANSTQGSTTIEGALPADCPYVFADLYISNSTNGDWFAGPSYNSASIYNNIYYTK